MMSATSAASTRCWKAATSTASLSTTALGQTFPSTVFEKRQREIEPCTTALTGGSAGPLAVTSLSTATMFTLTQSGEALANCFHAGESMTFVSHWVECSNFACETENQLREEPCGH